MRRALVLTLALGLLAALAAPAHGAVVATGPGGFTAGFVPPVVVIAEGEGIDYTNADIAPHNFVAADAYVPKKAARKTKWCSAFDKGKCPLFWSPTIGLGQSTSVSGLARLKSGDQFGFVCTLHPNMKGTLVVR